MMDPIVFQRASSLDEALLLLSRPEPEPTVLAGGTDVMVWMHSGGFMPKRIVDISPIRPECAEIVEQDDLVGVGALCTHAQIASSALLREKLPLLAEAAASIGAPPIRNRGTLGGNIGGSSPAGDILPVLLAYDATVVLQSAMNTREVPYREFCTGYRRTARRTDELITRIQCAPPPVNAVQRWYKVGGRLAQACSKVNLAALGTLDDQGRVALLRLGMGSCTATPILLAHAAATVVGQRISDDLVEEARRAVAKDISPIDDPRSTAQYRAMVAANLMVRYLQELREHGPGNPGTP